MDRGDLPQRVQLLGAPLGTPLPGGPRGRPPGRTRSCSPTRGCPVRRADRPGTGRPRRRPPGRRALRHPGGAGAAAGRARRRRAAARRPDRARRAHPGRTRPRLARLGVRVVTQPGFLPDRGDDFLRDLPSDDRPDLYRCATLRQACIPVALSSDAPYGPLDPWAVIAAATARRTASGQVVGPGERMWFIRARAASAVLRTVPPSTPVAAATSATSPTSFASSGPAWAAMRSSVPPAAVILSSAKLAICCRGR